MATEAELAARGLLSGNENRIQSAAVTVGALSNVDVVPASPGKRVRVLAYHLTVNDGLTDSSFQFRSSTATNLSGDISYVAGGGTFASIGFPSGQLFKTAVGESLNILNNGSAGIGGYVTYIQE